ARKSAARLVSPSHSKASAPPEESPPVYQSVCSTLVYSMPAPAVVRIATRESQLALAQTRLVAAALAAASPGLAVELVPMTTRGDQVLDRPLAQVGGKGLFVKELEAAMLAGRADLAVHSLKDVPMVLPPQFALATFGAREVAYDAF